MNYTVGTVTYLVVCVENRKYHKGHRGSHLKITGKVNSRVVLKYLTWEQIMIVNPTSPQKSVVNHRCCDSTINTCMKSRLELLG